MINPKQIFIWWHKQTFGTFLKTLFFGKFVGKDSYGNSYYKNRKDERWVVYQDNVEASKITSEWFLWMHHTINEIPKVANKRYSWQKRHLENQTGTINSYKPNFISKLNNIKKKYDTWKN
jgi:NADH:ubiquinone oxidoreductase subunit|tara:strand:+ start:133 stop:492 length:360 start_codon:yes stop_codon:yes gene_type:complete